MGKLFFVKYITEHFQTLGKNVLLSTTMGTVAFCLCSTTTTIHIAFRIPLQGYLSILLEPSNVIEKLKIANVIIMMTNNILCVMEQCLKQAMYIAYTSPFETKLVLLVGDLAPLPPICKHNYDKMTYYAKVVM